MIIALIIMAGCIVAIPIEWLIEKIALRIKQKKRVHKLTKAERKYLENDIFIESTLAGHVYQKYRGDSN